jgi:hypothetical protein
VAEAPTATAAARSIADALAAAGVPYAIGGAIALGLHAPPRATNDLDVNVFVEAEAVGPVLDALAAAGCAVDRRAAAQSARDRGDLRVTWHGMRVDVFVSSIPLHDDARRRVRTARLAGRDIRVLAPEDLAAFKLLFFRPKDIVDVELLVAFQGAALDVGLVRRSLVDAVGDDDERVRVWDGVVSRRGAGPRSP